MHGHRSRPYNTPEHRTGLCKMLRRRRSCKSSVGATRRLCRGLHGVLEQPGALRRAPRRSTVHSAPTVCQTTKFTLAGALECKSVRDRRELGRHLENDVINALAVEPLCGGVNVVRDPHPDFDGGGFSQTNFAMKQERAHWNLHLD